MELFTFEITDNSFNVIAHAVTPEEEQQLAEFTTETGIYGLWSRHKQTSWINGWVTHTTCTFNNVDRNTMLILQLGLK